MKKKAALVEGISTGHRRCSVLGFSRRLLAYSSSSSIRILSTCTASTLSNFQVEAVEHSEELCGEHHPVYTADEDTSNQQSDGNTHQTCQAYSSSLAGSTDRRGHAASAKAKLCLVWCLCKTLSFYPGALPPD